MTFIATRFHANRAHLRCGGIKDLHHWCVPNKSAAAAIVSIWTIISEDLWCFQHLLNSNCVLMQHWRQKKIIMVLIMVLSHLSPNGWTNLQQLNSWALSVFIFWVFELKVDAMGYHECAVYLKSSQKLWINILSLNQTKPRALNIFTN